MQSQKLKIYQIILNILTKEKKNLNFYQIILRKLGLEKNCVVLSTAHPCKFPKAIEDAISKTENLPDSLKSVNDRKEEFELLSNDIEKVKKYVMNSI